MMGRDIGRCYFDKPTDIQGYQRPKEKCGTDLELPDGVQPCQHIELDF
jgi:hypothetical protein